MMDSALLAAAVARAAALVGARPLPRLRDRAVQHPEADAGYRSEDKLKKAPIEVVVALGREGKEHAEIDAQPHARAGLMTWDRPAVALAGVSFAQAFRYGDVFAD